MHIDEVGLRRAHFAVFFVMLLVRVAFAISTQVMMDLGDPEMRNRKVLLLPKNNGFRLTTSRGGFVEICSSRWRRGRMVSR